MAASLDLRDLTEKQWDAQLFASKTGLAPMLGWRLTYHTLRSKGSRSGFPDRVLVRDRLIAVELKTESGPVSDAQREWLDGLAAAHVEAYLWRPRDVEEIGRILGRRQHWDPENGLHERQGQRWVYWQPRSLWLPGIGRADTIEQQSLLQQKGAA
jgi:hypothetical protein